MGHSKLTQAGRTTIDRRNNNGFGAFASLALGVLLMALHAHSSNSNNIKSVCHTHTHAHTDKTNNLVALQRGQTISVRRAPSAVPRRCPMDTVESSRAETEAEVQVHDQLQPWLCVREINAWGQAMQSRKDITRCQLCLPPARSAFSC